MIQWDQALATSVPIVVAIAEAARRLWTQRQKEHKENREMLEAILLEQTYLAPHDHIESRIPGNDNTELRRSGIIRRLEPPPFMKRRGTG